MPAPRGRDLELTRKRLCEWLSGKLPDARDLHLSELSGPDTTGYSSDTLLFEAAWREGGSERRQGLVARLKPSGYPVFPAYDIARQFRIQQILGGTEVPVPRMLWLEEDEGVLGDPFYVMERVPGRIPTDTPPYHAGGWMTEIDPREQASLWWSGLEILGRIHRLDWRALGLGFLDEGRGATPLERQLAYYERYFEWAARRRNPICEAALDWLKRNRPPEEEPAVLAWGDARLGNMIFRDQRCVAVLDWEMAAVASPELDLGWWIFMDHHHSAGFDVPRLPGLPAREETVARYCEQTGFPVCHLEYYEIFAALRFSVIMIRLAQQLIAYGVLPPESGFETDNIPTRLLARMLELPPPGG